MRAFALVALLFGVSFAATTCNNPLLESMAVPFGLTIPAAPAAHVDFTVCKNLNSYNTCCTAEMMGNLTTDWEALKNQTTQAMGLAAYYFKQAVSALGNQYPKLVNAINRMFNGMSSAVLVMMQHYSGLFCYMCDANWASYWNADKTIMYFSSETCDSLVNSFSEYLHGFDDLIQAFSDYGLPGTPSTVKICQTTDACKTAICSKMFGTASFSMGSPFSSTLELNQQMSNMLQTLRYNQAASNASPKADYTTSTGYKSVAVGKASGLSGSGALNVVPSMAAAFFAAVLAL
ncbi:hypothetical protein PAPYR_6931 [Paratrimastix pyriformis]|uniref:Uncharacterized protein n=1 Tax=Paratrimastix pyriformis TaxID=342808 RepID=A0ABQ8UEA1_9EUKA|nr:hypothetical protein PAPYR_6931 [Paratrimastix pyriformis]